MPLLPRLADPALRSSEFVAIGEDMNKNLPTAAIVKATPTAVIVVIDRAVFLTINLPEKEPERAIAAGMFLRDQGRLGGPVRLALTEEGANDIDDRAQVAVAARYWSEATGLPLYDMRRDRTIAIADPVEA